MGNSVTLKTGTVSGTLLSMIPNLTSEDIMKTIALAVIGAAASFIVTCLLQRCRPRR